jgi:phosphatidate cytidylyltransferase|tara:strand:+ start:668 stop:1303 length:636 start_codon:yes stop_codon:yes gene_type:complete
MNNFFLRLVSALILAPVFLYLVFINNIFFIILLLFILLVSLYEFKFLFIANKIHFFLMILLVIVFLFSFHNLRASSELDFYYLLWIVAIVWLSDTGGFFIGKFFKGPRLSKWSPNKTLSGFAGSLILSQLAFCIIFLALKEVSFSCKFFIIQIFICIVSVFGDLFFSYIKRKNNIKDYSSIIPGHGGLMDRIDGLIFAIIFANILKVSHVY